ncbi:MAG: serpin family protein [Gemmatimonadetes bacterium]|nr:serpin family protein [Gemmatimonadota bacterium]
MRILTNKVFGLALSTLLLGACSDSPTGVDEITQLPRPLTANEQAVIQASNAFAFDLLRQASRADSSLFLSPLSASMALGMTLNGAEADTYEQMRKMLGFGTLSREHINESYRDLIALLRGLDRAVEVGIGNSVWIREGFPVEPAFLDVVQRFFDARAANLDFSDPRAAETINAWVREATKSRIDKIVEPPIDPLTMLFLINAIYFKGTWTYEFDKSKTRDASFHLRNGTTAAVKLMEVKGGFPYQMTDRFQAVDLPYGGKAFAMTVVLPRESVDLESIVGTLDAQAWRQIVDGFREANGTVYLPRLRVEYERLLNDDLFALGMTDAFIPARADLSRIYRAAKQVELHVKQVKQKTFVDVNEEGTEAAAVTSVEIGVTSCCDGFEMRADGPFLFAIRERLSGTILFVGKIVAPPAQ